MENQRLQTLERRSKSHENKFKFSTLPREILSTPLTETFTSTTVTPEKFTTDSFKTGEDESTDSIVEILSPQIIEKNLSNENDLGNMKMNDGTKNNSEHCCIIEDHLRLILPPSENDDDNFCPKSLNAQILLPISAKKLAIVPMKELMNLSSPKNISSMLRDLLEIVEKYNL